MTTTAVDWADPCARFAALQQAYYQLLSGQSAVEIRTRNFDAEELVRFQSVDIASLRVAMRDAESQCAISTGQPDPNRRFAIRTGYRRRGPWPRYDDPVS